MSLVVLFELNEVPWQILDDYVDERPTSAMAGILARSRCFTSIAADEGHLSPWTTWPTLHRGVNDQRHMIASLGQERRDADRDYPPVWSLLRGRGVRVGLCGTLHSAPPPADISSYEFYLPDAFASDPVAHPASLVDFQRFNLAMSRRSARNVDAGIARNEAWTVLRRTRRLGIRPGTYAALGRHLLSERRRPAIRNRRRTYQSVLLFDIFEQQLRRTKPEFSSFFSNHLAAAMHRYWAAHRPGDYDELELDQCWLDTFRREVMWATEQADDMLARLAKFIDAAGDGELWIASSMGQRATRADALETQVYLTQPTRFLRAMGLPDDAWQRRPAMLPQFNLVVRPEHIQTFGDALPTVRIGGDPLGFSCQDGGFFSLDFGQPNLHNQADAVCVAGEPRSLDSLGLQAVEIEDRSGTTAYHVPDGVLAVYDPTRPVHTSQRPEVSVLEVAPTLLRRFGIQPPDYMVQPTVLDHLPSGG
jgi:hypothetical protein